MTCVSGASLRPIGMQMTNPAPVYSSRSRALVNLVLIEAVGSSFTPFVPVPFVDDYLFARLLRRITHKVAEREGHAFEKVLAKAIVDGYLEEGDPGLGSKAITTVGRFVVRKLAVVLDVKKSHDVFGESIAYALALDHAEARQRARNVEAARSLGGALYRSTQAVGSAALEVITHAGREAWSASAGESSRLARVAEAIARQVDDTHGRLEHVVRSELARDRR